MNQRKDTITSEGKTVEEAVSEALLQLGARRDEVEIEVIEEGRGGVLGLFGKKMAVVKASRVKRKGGRRGGRRGRRPKPVDRDERPREASDDKPRRDDGRRGGGKPRDDRRQEKRREQAPREDAPAKARGNRDDEDGSSQRRPRRRRRRGGGGGGGEKPAPETQARTESREKPRSERPRDEKPRDEKPRDERPPRQAAKPKPESAQAPRDEAPAPKRHEELESAKVMGDPVPAMKLAQPEPAAGEDDAPRLQQMFSEKLLTMGGFTGRCEVQEDEYNQVRVIVDMDSAGILIGRHGYTIDALEHLVERMTSRTVGERMRMNLDINNYRRRREGKLVNMARDAMARVKSGGGEDHLPTMNPRDRRTVHMEVARDDSLDTYTAGHGPDRHVVVIPADQKREEEPAAESVPEEPAVETPAEDGTIEAMPIEAAAAEGDVADGPEADAPSEEEPQRRPADEAPADDV